jgi:hypothetical protein
VYSHNGRVRGFLKKLGFTEVDICGSVRQGGKSVDLLKLTWERN